MTLALLVLLAANPFLAEALEQEQNLDFEKCVQRLKQASTQWKNTPAESRDIELHLGLCTFNLGDTRAAGDHFRMALRLDEAADLPAYTSPKAVELFLSVKKSLQAAAPPLPDSDLPDDRPTVDPPTAPPKKLEPPVIGTGPSPAGEFLSRRALPLSLGIVTLASAATALGLGLRAQTVATTANAAHFEADFEALASDARGLATASSVTWVLAGASALGTFITWWVTGEPPVSAP